MRRQLSRPFIALAALAAVSLLATACGSSSSSSGSSASTSSGHGTVNVLAVVDTSGPNKTIGTGQLAGIQAGAAYLNAHGGILGHQVVVSVADDNGDPTTATSALVQDLSSDPGKYTMIYGGEEGTIVSALIPVIARYKVLAMAPNDGDDLCARVSTCPTEFALTGSNSVIEVAEANWYKSHGYTNVGMIVEQIAFTQTEADYLKQDLTNDGIKSEIVGFPTSATSLTPEMSELKSDGAQAVYAAAYGPPEGYVLNARPELSWQAPVMFEAAGSSLNIPQLAPASELSDAYETPFYCDDPSVSVPGIGILMNYAKDTTYPVNGSLPCSLWGQGWDTVIALNAAAQKAGSLNTSALVQAMQQTKVTTANGLIRDAADCWTATDHENVCETPSDYAVQPVGTLVGGRLEPVGASS
jgi:branched-chain amino acid transport system substrate-binding protein